MILSGKEIEKQLNQTVFIDPYTPSQLNPNSYNLRLHHELLLYDEPILDMKKPNAYHYLTIPEEGLVLQPGTLYLGRTVERTYSNKFVPKLEGRSSVGRLGIFVHITASLGNLGANGYWTLEITCVQPVRIYPNVEICQVYFQNLMGEATVYDNGKYQDNKGVQPSLMYKDFTTDISPQKP